MKFRVNGFVLASAVCIFGRFARYRLTAPCHLPKLLIRPPRLLKSTEVVDTTSPIMRSWWTKRTKPYWEWGLVQPTYPDRDTREIRQHEIRFSGAPNHAMLLANFAARIIHAAFIRHVGPGSISVLIKRPEPDRAQMLRDAEKWPSSLYKHPSSAKMNQLSGNDLNGHGLPR